MPQPFEDNSILKELNHVRDSPFLNGITAGPVNDCDIYNWLVTIPGPEGSLYAGGLYKLSIKFPKTYPSEQPEVKFITQINHPKITNEGRIHLEILERNWQIEGMQA